MYIFRCLHLLWFFPASWLDAFFVRRKPFDIRYMHMSRWGTLLMKLFHVTFDVKQASPLPNDVPILFISNHQSAFDMMMLMGGIHIPFSFISKKENQKVPYVGSWSKSLEILFFDREDTKSAIHMLRESARRLKGGHNLLIFPEGTRNKEKGKLLPLQAGSMQPAMMTKALIVPVVLVNSYDYVNVMKHKKTAKMHILEPITFEEYKPLKNDGLASLLQERMQAVLDAESDV